MKRSISCLAVLLCAGSLGLWGINAEAQTTGEIAKGNAKSCAMTCQKTVDYCNARKGKFSQASVLNTMKDCITTCKTADELLSRSSNLSPKAAAICVEACDECAKACDQYHGDAQLTECANECRKTASNMQKVK